MCTCLQVAYGLLVKNQHAYSDFSDLNAGRISLSALLARYGFPANDPDHGKD